jgi:aldehyde dehydrogenase (NAD+)
MNISPIDVCRKQQQFFRSGAPRSAAFRKEQLKKLDSLLRNNEKKIEDALYADLHKHPQVVYTTELAPVYEEILLQLKHLKKWMQPKRVSTPVYLQPSVSRLYPEPVGNVLIISPWNFPVLLSFRATVGAMAAGNTILIKPSEYAVHSAALLEEICNQNFPNEYLYVLNGNGHDVLPVLFDECHFGKVFFTGSTAVGSKIMEMASRKLSPVSLELGGKSPCIVDATANIRIAAKRIVWGKFLNCGQSCVAPDYLMVHRSVKQTLVAAIISEIETTYGNEIKSNPDYGRIIHERRYQTLKNYLKQGEILYGGETDDAERFIGPTLLQNIQPGASVLKEEIFGPILPIFTYDNTDEVLAFIEENPYPLALYVFSNDSNIQDLFIKEVPFGGGCINETTLHLGNSNIPFGGIGTSGMGGHLGKYSFDLFSHYKGIVNRKNWFEPAFRFPPYNLQKLKLWKFLLGRKRY